MCDLDIYRARIGRFCGVTRKTTVNSNDKVRNADSDTGGKVADILSMFVFCWLLVLMLKSIVFNAETLFAEGMSVLEEKAERSETVVCGEECVWGDHDSASASLHVPHVSLAMHVSAVLSFVVIVNQTFSMWRLRLSGDVEENPGPDHAPSEANSDQGQRHEDSPSDVNRGQHSDDMRATGSEGEGNFTRAVHATPPDINRDRDTASPLCDAGPSLIGLMAQGEGRGEKESPGRDAVDHTSDSLTSQPSRGGGRGGGNSPRHDVAGAPAGTCGGRGASSSGRQHGLRGNWRNQTSEGGNARPSRNKQKN
ncbi:hypothetical protein ACOMHN_006149 [Nucella lapillus]